MNNQNVVGKVLQQQEISRVEGSGSSSRETLDTDLQALKGQVVSARVLEVTPQGKAILEIGGQMFEVTANDKMQAGQTLLIKIQSIQPNLVFDILFTDNKGQERNLLAALRSILTSDNKLTESIRSLEIKLSSINLDKLPELPREMIQQLKQILSAIDVKTDSQEVIKAIKNFISISGMNLEWQLSGLAEGKEMQGLENNLKMLLNQLLSQVEKQIQAIEVRPLPQPMAEQLIQSLENFKINLEKTALPPEILSKLLRQIDSLIKSVPREINDQAQQSRFIQQFTNLQKALSLVTSDPSLAPGPRSQAENLFRQLLQNIESRFQIPQEGRDFFNRLMLAGLGKDAEQIREKLEAFQVLSAPVADRAVTPHLILPVSILNELTDVQIKQLASGSRKGTNKDSVTVVMLLELETLGKVRIDTLCQEKVLYVNIAVENEQVVDLVERMTDMFSLQLEARGMRLAKLVCKLDNEKIEKFHDLESRDVIIDQGLINLKV